MLSHHHLWRCPCSSLIHCPAVCTIGDDWDGYLPDSSTGLNCAAARAIRSHGCYIAALAYVEVASFHYFDTSPQFGMPCDESKREITRQNLKAHNIFFEPETLRPPYKLPEYVDVVRETLLTFVNIIPEGGWQETLQREVNRCDPNAFDIQALHPPASSLVPVTPQERDKNIKGPQWLAADENLESCGLIAEEAERLYRDAEKGWEHFWRSKTFAVVDEKARKLPGFQ